jgi:hypothetical protein
MAAQLMSSPVWREGPSWYVDKNKWPVQPDELASLIEYSEYLTDRGKKQKAYLDKCWMPRGRQPPRLHMIKLMLYPAHPARQHGHETMMNSHRHFVSR